MSRRGAGDALRIAAIEFMPAALKSYPQFAHGTAMRTIYVAGRREIAVSAG